MTGYAIIGISLFVFVQARNVYPQLLLGRILFSVGGAAAYVLETIFTRPVLGKNV